jgi:quinol monooxygenase YgiN
MITVLTTFEVQPGREQEFEEMWRQACPQRARHPGLRTERLLRHLDQHGRYIIFHEWEDREQFDAQMRASGMLWLIDDTEIWVPPPSFSYWEDVEEVAQNS